MEQSVWFIYAVLAAMVMLGVVITISVQHSDQLKLGRSDRVADQLVSACNFVCRSEGGTQRFQDVDFPSGLVLRAHANQICTTYDQRQVCRVCDCSLSDYTLDLSTPQHLHMFDIHTFRCLIAKQNETITLDCQG
ncbi:MAG: hypothetical protein ACMXYF_04065 [Candidatus Woesearchaeota archaeon]